MFNRNLKLVTFFTGLLLFFAFTSVHAQETTTKVDSSTVVNSGISISDPVTVESPSEKIIIYATTTCPHCKRVKAFVAANEVPDVEFRNVDVNKTYLDEYNALYAKYNVEEKNRGVPVLENNGGLISGDQPIIDFLTTKYNITPKEEDKTLQTSGSDMAFIAIGGLVLLAVIGYGVYSTIKKS
jgi:glutaredoxin